MAIKSVHLSLASTNTNVCRVIVTDDSGLNKGSMVTLAAFRCLVDLT